MTIKTWEQRRQELIDKGADAGYIGPMHAEIAELREALQESEDCAINAAMEYKKLKREAVMLRESNAFISRKRYAAKEEALEEAAVFCESMQVCHHIRGDKIGFAEFDGTGTHEGMAYAKKIRGMK